jgi:hypothetical protein
MCCNPENGWVESENGWLVKSNFKATDDQNRNTKKIVQFFGEVEGTRRQHQYSKEVTYPNDKTLWKIKKKQFQKNFVLFHTTSQSLAVCQSRKLRIIKLLFNF